MVKIRWVPQRKAKKFLFSKKVNKLPFKDCQSWRDNVLYSMDTCFLTVLLDMLKYFLTNIYHIHDDFKKGRK